MKDQKEFSFRISYVVYSSPDKVFEALTDPGIIAAWGGGLSVVEPREGGKLEMFDGWIKGHINLYKAGKELEYTWKPSEWSAKTAASTVNFRLREHEAGTEIIINHKDLPSQEEADKHKEGWIDFVLDPMNDYFTS